MNLLQLPWLDYSLLIALVGALWVGRQREPMRAFWWGLAFTGTVLAFTVLAWLGFYLGVPLDGGPVRARRSCCSDGGSSPWTSSMRRWCRRSRWSTS